MECCNFSIQQSSFSHCFPSSDTFLPVVLCLIPIIENQNTSHVFEREREREAEKTLLKCFVHPPFCFFRAVPKFMKRIKVPDYKDRHVFGVPFTVNVQRSGQPLPQSIQQAMRYLRNHCLDQVRFPSLRRHCGLLLQNRWPRLLMAFGSVVLSVLTRKHLLSKLYGILLS